ncbi:CHAT domain-containing protein [Hyalangium sp.]|uniref:CHAT domain-containing protein n=1 Tax=Hyalangium sp. TaxID=2028555 RepID=UPI002D2664D9|nr:CHAT domain-containing protein [Hyalangium sp.]HYH98618.1 CHAT domain-containing protein [Hyalangium sp.]
MSAHCERIERFADGELAPEEAEAFREHLLDCARCKAELGSLLQLKMMASRHVERQPLAAVPAPARRSFSRWSVAAAVGTACAALLAIGVFVRSGSSRTDPWLMSEPERRLEMRLAIASADRHRPLSARKMGQEPSKSGKLPLEALTELERNDDAAGLAAAFLARNDRSLVEQAQAYLAPLPSTPENETLRATALLMKGAPQEALRHLELALAQAPQLPQALWNKGLALRDLDLPESAALAFREVAEQGEPGWAEEARQHAEALEAEEQARIQRWKAVVSASQALATDGTLPPAEILAERPPILRLHFYNAVRTRTSREQVQALLPLARELDQQAGGGEVLAGYVERIAARDFARRAPLAQAYAQLRQGTLPPEQLQALIAELLRSPEDDLLMGVLVYAKAVASHLEAFEARAEASQDPWFQLLAAQERAAAQLARGQEEEARQTLLGAHLLCASTPIEYRCELIRLNLSAIQTRQLRLDEAWTLTEQVWRHARATNNRGTAEEALARLAQLARLRNDGPLTRACFTELLARNPPEDKAFERFAHQTLAHLALSELRFELARVEIDRAMATGLPLTYGGAMALADISRRRPAPGDEAAMHRAFAEAPATLKPVHRWMLRHALGRFTIERDRQKGRALLEEALQGVESAGLLTQEEDAQKLKAYTFTSLILDAAKSGDYGAALELFGREQSSPLPARCLVAVTEDSERSLLIVRGTSGQILGSYEGARRTRLPEDLSGFVPGEALTALQGCEKVEAFARPPLQDRPGLLPTELAWSYRLRAGLPTSPRTERAVHLVVKDVALSPERVQTLGRLNAWKAAFGPTEEQKVLMGTEATPSRVLAAMRDATEIDMVTHGIITSSRFSYLVLAREGSSDELRAGHIQAQRLEGAPLVVLAACRAARGAYILHEPSGLPAAFIQAGARAVIAATEEIPDLEAAEFFNAVRERIRQGSTPASALRDERRKWLAENKGQQWLKGVLLYD